MTQKELIDKVASETGETKLDTKMMVNALVRVICEELEEGVSVRLPELGTFSIGVVSERNVYNPLRFKPSKGLKDHVNR